MDTSCTSYPSLCIDYIRTEGIHAYLDRIFLSLILLIKMLLTALYFVLFTFTNGEEGKVSSKKKH
jgi:hypothetical protein